MKIFTILSVAFVLAYTAIGGGESNNKDSFTCVSKDTIVNGFFLESTKIHPFSPMVFIEFNLPESSMVTLFVTDTLNTDTTYLCRQKFMGSGFYKTLPGVIGKIGERKDYRIMDIHLLVNSNYGSSGFLSIKSSFIAIRRMAFR